MFHFSHAKKKGEMKISPIKTWCKVINTSLLKD
jgi:hypothetical protein